MGYEVCLHEYTRIYTNKQMGYEVCLHYEIYEVCLHGYARINKWVTRFVYMDIHE